MTLDDVRKAYADLIDRESKILVQKKKAIFRVGSLRLILVLACIGVCYMVWGNAMVVVGSILATLIPFLFLLKYHNKLFIEKRYSEIQIINAENELRGIDYDFSPFDGAPERNDGNHSFSSDLDIFGTNSFFQSINRTVTNDGKNYLVNTILSPLEERECIEKRHEAIQELTRRSSLLAHFRATGQMDETGNFDIQKVLKQFSQIISAQNLSNSIWKFAIYILPCLSVILILAFIFDQIPTVGFLFGWVALIFVSAAPMKTLKRSMGIWDKNKDSLQTYSQLFKILEDNTFDSALLVDIQSKIRGGKTASETISQLDSLVSNLFQSFTFPGILVLNPLLGWSARYGISTEKWVQNNNQNMKEWFEAIAAFDTFVSLAIYAYNHPSYTYPKISDRPMFEAKDLGHPMLKREVCIHNDVDIAKHPFFLVVTGANMAGKSTYLRTVGLNHTLACIGAPVCASELELYPFRLVTNLRTSDSLADSESYFFAELKRLKMIIDRLQAGEKLLIILDEILKGTNSEDKQKGSIALVKQLVSLSSCGIIATHDLILGNLQNEFPDSIKNYCFEADIKDENLSFTYKIRVGVAQNMNACFLMKKMGITGL